MASGAGVLPFDDASLPLIIDRHEGFLPGEVARVLQPGGLFLTQQVGDGYPSLAEIFKESSRQARSWNLGMARHQFEQVGLEIQRAQETHALTEFFDVGAVVYYLRSIPWIVPGFGPQRHLGALRGVHEHIETVGSLGVREYLFYLEARKPTARD